MNRKLLSGLHIQKLLLSAFVASNPVFAQETGAQRGQMALCTEVLGVHFEQHQFSLQSLQAPCECTRATLLSNFPSKIDGWLTVGPGSATEVAIRCSEKMLTSSFFNIFSAANNAELSRRGITAKSIDQLSHCQAKAGYRMTLDAARGMPGGAHSSEKSRRLLDECADRLFGK